MGDDRSDRSDSSDDSTRLSRRTFMQASGALAASGALGATATTAAAQSEFHREFANPRVWELQRVWQKGYRGRPSRSVGVGDSGCDGRHPDLSWNNVRIEESGNDITLKRVVGGEGGENTVGTVGSFSGTLGPGAADAGEVQRETHELDVPDDADEIDVEATWTPQRQDNELFLLDENGDEVASSTDFNPQSGAGERIKAPVEPGYEVAIETYINAAADYEITGEYVETTTTVEPVEEDFDPLPDSVGKNTPKLVGWQGRTFARDANGHGTHVSSITAGSGEGSAIDESSVTEEEPQRVLLPGEFLEYTVTPEAGNDDAEDNGGVYAAVYGENLEIGIEAPDGRTVESTAITSDSSASGDVTTAETHAEDAGEYTVHVRPTDDGAGTSTGRVQRVSVGALLPPSSTAGDRTGDAPTLHAGVAPNASLVTIQGLGNSLDSLSSHPAFYTETFGLRTANFSFGGLPSERLGIDDGYAPIETMAEGGILTVSSAGNNGPLTGATGPSGASEAIAVAATGPMDGLTAYTSGGTVARDGDGDTYRKPDVTAPGGTLDDTVNAVEAGDPDGDDPVRGYTGKAGTSMAAPYTNGVAGLVAEAMEFGGPGRPEGLTLPEPSETGRKDVLRLKQVILATATETAFTAAPYHRAHAPTYDFGERDQFEGYGRVNPDAAVDAVTRELTPGTISETVGLNRHSDARAVAGYLPGDAGTYTVGVSVSHLSGGNEGMAKGDPHVDIYVYDIADAEPYGEPAIAARAMGVQGDAEVSLSVPESDGGAYVAVAKLVNIPGVVNGYDVQAHLDLSVDFDAPPVVTDATREDDGSVFTGGQSNQIDLDIATREPVEFRDVIPIEWDVETKFGDVDHVHTDEEAGVKYVNFTGHGTDPAVDSPSVTYLAEAPDDPAETGEYGFGPAEVSTDGGETWVPVAGTTDTNYVVGQST
ncbi:MAG: S8 family serine peptidase [Natronomonas sp.]